MIVMVIERCSKSKRGQLTRWLVEFKTGVFVGQVSARVREKLWDMICEDIEGKEGVILIYNTSETEQGFMVKSYGTTDRIPVDIEGLVLSKYL
jgi:CRISPR-associated protein Cas2